jgi:DNA polymerase (family 10)
LHTRWNDHEIALGFRRHAVSTIVAMMKNKGIAEVFSQIADLLEIMGEQPFRVNSYRRASRTLETLTQDVAELAAAKTLTELQGIGKSTAAKIEEYLTTGSVSLHSELQESVPAGLPLLLNIPGLGPKRVAQAWKELGVENLNDLKKAISDRRLLALKGFGEKLTAQIVRGIEFAEKSTGRTPLGLALPLAEELAEAMRAVPAVRRAEVTGSVRRGQETIGDIDVLCEADDGSAVVKAFTALPQVKRVLASGSTKGCIIVDRRDGIEIQVDCRAVPTESFGAALQYFTGSKEHNIRLREIALKKKWKLNEWGLFDGEESIAGREEAEIYDRLGLPLIPPELREDNGEFETDAMKPLIEPGDIRGDLHLHTTASDGTSDAPTMAQAASERGHEYIAVTDHSKSSTVANGLSIDRMWRHVEKLRALNKDLKTITVLVGCECDILADGKLDYPDQLLAACDIVVASVHSGMNQGKEKLTARVLKAMENPYVNVLGHPSGRLLNRREPMDLDMAAVIAQATRTQTAMELNASWQRLDLNDRHLRMAIDAGALISIGTDAHSIRQLDQMRYGVITARRGWLQAKDVLNTQPLPSVRKWLVRKRR